MILSFSRGVSLIWKRSKFRAVLITVGVPLLFVGILAAIVVPQFAVYARSENDGIVKRNLRNAAEAEEAYYRNNGSYTANIGNLKGFKQSAHVAIAVEATMTTYVIIGTATKRCEPYTGRWTIDSTTGAINGTPCRVTMHGLATMTLP